MLLTRLPLPLRGVRLACVKPAASVRPEPGSNSQVEFGIHVPGGKSRRSSLLTFVAKPNSPNERRIFGLHLKNVSDDGSSSNSFARSVRCGRKVPLGRRRPRFSSSIFNCQRARRPRPTACAARLSRQKTDTPEAAPGTSFEAPGGRLGRVGGGADLATPLLPVNASSDFFSSLAPLKQRCSKMAKTPPKHAPPGQTRLAKSKSAGTFYL